MAHIFISYSTKDSDYAYLLADKLRAEGFDVWIDNAQLRSGDNWWQAIVQALRSCSAFIVIMTPDAKASRWVQREVTLADNWEKPAFPLLLTGENWEIYVNTQFENVSSGQLPPAAFYETLTRAVPRKSQPGEIVSDKPLQATPEDNEVRQAIAQPPPKDRPEPQPTDERQQRRLEAAMPACTRPATETEVQVKISLADSEGLRAELPDVIPSGEVIQKGDVRDSAFHLTFPRDPKTGKLLPGQVCVKVVTNDFIVQMDSSDNTRCADDELQLELRPDEDSRKLIFVLKPKSEQSGGISRVFVQLLQDGKKIAEVSLSTEITHDTERPMCKVWQLSVAPLLLPVLSGWGSSTLLPDNLPAPAPLSPARSTIQPQPMSPARKSSFINPVWIGLIVIIVFVIIAIVLLSQGGSP